MYIHIGKIFLTKRLTYRTPEGRSDAFRFAEEPNSIYTAYMLEYFYTLPSD